MTAAANWAANGASLEDCHSNLFSLVSVSLFICVMFLEVSMHTPLRGTSPHVFSLALVTLSCAPGAVSQPSSWSPHSIPDETPGSSWETVSSLYPMAGTQSNHLSGLNCAEIAPKNHVLAMATFIADWVETSLVLKFTLHNFCPCFILGIWR